MKTIRLSFMLSLLFASTSLFAKPKTESFKVLGNCGMCKNRIEKAVKVEGVSKASWDNETRLLTVTYETRKVKAKQLQQLVAAAGHDTEKAKANDAVYEALPGCCQYDRSGKTSGSH